MVIVIAILATITIVSFGQIQNRAHDTAVQSDLRALGLKIEEYRVEQQRIPSALELPGIGVKVSKGSYGSHYIPTNGTSENNLLYCRAGTDRFILVAGSKSGSFYFFSEGQVRKGTSPLVSYTSTCENYGLTSTDATWMYAAGTWRDGL